MQFVRQQVHLHLMAVKIGPVGYSVVDLRVKRLHGVLIVARSQQIPLAPGGLGPSSLLRDHPNPAAALTPPTGLSSRLSGDRLLFSHALSPVTPGEPDDCSQVSASSPVADFTLSGRMVTPT